MIRESGYERDISYMWNKFAETFVWSEDIRQTKRPVHKRHKWTGYIQRVKVMKVQSKMDKWLRQSTEEISKLITKVGNMKRSRHVKCKELVLFVLKRRNMAATADVVVRRVHSDLATRRSFGRLCSLVSSRETKPGWPVCLLCVYMGCVMVRLYVGCALTILMTGINVSHFAHSVCGFASNGDKRIHANK
jgi:hypothetical protein